MLLTYENEVILTNEVYGDKALPYLVPSFNIRIECPLALVDKASRGAGAGGRRGGAPGPALRAAAAEAGRPPWWRNDGTEGAQRLL